MPRGANQVLVSCALTHSDRWKAHSKHLNALFYFIALILVSLEAVSRQRTTFDNLLSIAVCELDGRAV